MLCPCAHTQSELRSAFLSFDRDRNGYITARELSQVLQSLGRACSLADAEVLIAHVDANGDGRIELDEFVKFMMNQTNLMVDANLGLASPTNANANANANSTAGLCVHRTAR